MADEVMTVDEAAEFLKLCTATVRRLLARGELPGRHVGRQWRTTKRALLNYIDGGDQGGGQAEGVE